VGGKKKWLLIGLATLGILCAGDYALWCVWQNHHSETEKEKRVQADFARIAKAMTIWINNYGAWPSSLEELANPQPNGDPALLATETLMDPWGQPYDFVRDRHRPFKPPVIYSIGPPGQDKIIRFEAPEPN
jgi:Type II secretion system (T2SS), protein G